MVSSNVVELGRTFRIFRATCPEPDIDSAMENVAFVEELRQFVAEREWSQFHDPKNLAMLLASEAGELLAEYRWVRNEQSDAFSRDPEARRRIADEVGDVGIALMLLCDRIGLDLQAAMREKLARNRQRYPVEHSKGKATRPVG
jgi:NTP pyrophosphatase (non-canonical NTP hydrolase)